MKVQVFHMIRIDETHENYTHYRASVFGSPEASSTLWNKDGYRLAGEFDFGHLAPVGRDLDTMEVVQ